MSDLIGHAVRIAEELGAPVFPVRVEDDPAHPGRTLKRPLVKGWSNGAARSNAEGIEELFAAHPQATHAGIQCGRLLVIDLDGEDAQRWWREHAAMLPPTRTQRTRRAGGLHLIYRVPAGAVVRNSAGTIAPGVDVRGAGGFIVDWSSEHPPAVDEVTEAPAALVAYIKTAAGTKPRTPAAATPAVGGICEGARNDYLARQAGKMRATGLSGGELEAALLVRNRERCEPPLLAQEVAAIARSIAKYEPRPESGVTFDDFWAVMPMHAYIYTPSGELWPGPSVNARLPAEHSPDGKVILPTMQLDQRKPVEQLTWAPGEPLIIRNRLVSAGGWIEREGVSCLNLYRPPTLKHGDAASAGPWLDHARRIYPESAEHIIPWLAHRVQRPGEKINHGLVLGGNQGIGKDTLLEPAKHAVGPWNFSEVSPQHLLGRFNGFVKSVILRVSEAHDLGEVDRYAFYDHTKVYTAAPPDVLRCDEKNIREHSVFNICGVILTSNHKQDGLYLPADDRRHYVAWSELSKEDFDPAYWATMYGWYAAGGIGHVAAYLAQLDISDFDPKAPPPKTAAFFDIVDANRSPEDSELADVLDILGNPQAVTLPMLGSRAGESFQEWLLDRRNRRQIPHRLEAAGYVVVRSPSAEDGLWKIHGKRSAVYARRDLSARDRMVAAAALAAGGRR